LFVFQYGLDLLDLRDWLPPGGVDLAAEALPRRRITASAD
jgi:hypothetical protein